MDSFLCGTLLALARKCEEIDAELERLDEEQLKLLPLAERTRALCGTARTKLRSEVGSLRASVSGLQGEELEREELRAQRRRAVTAGKRAMETAADAEHGVLPFLARFDEESAELSRLCNDIAIACQWRATPPLVSRCNVSYFEFHPTREPVIMAPALANSGDLSCVDLVHEMAHALLYEPAYERVILGEWLDFEFVKTKATACATTELTLDEALWHWCNVCIPELACDVMATYVTGPAYAWQHIALWLGRKDNESVYKPGTAHPSDAARFAAITATLGRLGDLQAREDEILATWENVVLSHGPADTETSLYPPEMIEEFVAQVCDGCEVLGIRAYSADLPDDDPCQLVNLRWRELAREGDAAAPEPRHGS